MKYTAIIAGTLAQVAWSATYSLSATIPWSTKPASVDQSLVINGIYYLADRTLAGVHVVSLANNTEITAVKGFITTLKSGAIDSSNSGPEGMIALPEKNELWVGDGNGTVRVISTKTYQIIANISTGSVLRADEFAYDPSTGIVIVTNPNEKPPFVTVMQASNHSVVGRITFADASGLEQPTFDSVSGSFYVSVPSTNSSAGGVIRTIDVKNMSIVSTMSLPDCVPAGIIFGPSQNLFVSCSSTQISKYNLAASYVVNGKTGAVIANISGVAGVDQVAYSSKTNMYYASAYQMTTGGRTGAAPAPILAVIDAASNTLTQTLVTDNVTAHSVAVDNVTGNIIVPIQAKGMVVYSLANTTSNSTATTTATPPTKTTSAASLIVPGLTISVGAVLVAMAAQLL